MKTAPLLLLTISSYTITSCTSSNSPGIPVAYIPFSPPKGITAKGQVWDGYGPGSVLTRPTQTQYRNASGVIGSQKVSTLSQPSSWQPVTLGKGTVDRQAQIDAAATVTYKTLVEAGLDGSYVRNQSYSYQFGQSYECQIPQEELGEVVRTKANSSPRLKKLFSQKNAEVVQSVLITNEMTVTVKDSNQKKINLDATLTKDQKAKIGASHGIIKQDTITFSSPHFAAYRPLHKSELKD